MMVIWWNLEIFVKHSEYVVSQNLLQIKWHNVKENHVKRAEQKIYNSKFFVNHELELG